MDPLFLTFIFQFQMSLTNPYYRRKTDRGKWSAQDMLEAAQKVRDKELSLRQAAEQYNVPKSTLERRVTNKNKIVKENEKYLGRYRKVFSDEQEEEIVDYILEMEKRFFGITYKELRQLAFDFASANGIPNNFNKDTKMASKKWIYGFLNRHKNVSLRKPEATSYARATGFNKNAVRSFFKNLEAIYEKHKLTADRIWNIDETGVTTVQKLPKILAQKGKKQVGGLTSAERGVNVTIVASMSASGHFLSPAFIFPRKRIKPELMDNAPSGSPAFPQDKGWMDRDVFLQYMKYFVEQTRPSKERPILIILDGHSSHTKSLPVIDFCRENGVILLCLPPHCTHKIQPLDVSYFKSFMTNYDAYLFRWLKNHGGRTFGLYQIAGAVAEAFEKSSSVQTAVNGFRRTGIWPFNDEIFQDWEFAASETTNLEQNSDNIVDHREKGGEPLIFSKIQSNPYQDPTPSTSEESITLPPPEALQNNEFNSSEDELPLSSLVTKWQNERVTNKSSALKVKIIDISPLPTADKKQRKPTLRRSLKSTILTESPYKNELEALQTTKSNKKIAVKKALVIDDKSTQGAEKPSSSKNKTSMQMDSATADDTPCIVCGDKYMESGEDWYNCHGCSQWAHETCGIIDEMYFTCAHCEE